MGGSTLASSYGRVIESSARFGISHRRTTIIVPCYNEASRLDCDSFQDFAMRNPEAGFVFVDDGSYDHTLQVLETLRGSSAEQFRVLRLPLNLGKGEAVRRGVLEALKDEPDHIGYWDADLATSLDEIAPLREELCSDPQLEIVLGSRVKLLGRDIQRNPVRHYLGRIVATLVSMLLQIPVYDSQCGAKLFRVTKHLETIFATPFITRWLFDVEILARWLDLHPGCGGEKISQWVHEVPLQRWVDVKETKIQARDCIRTPIDLLRIYLHYRSAR